MVWNSILFDLDGTLTESGPGITRSVQYALHQMGIEEPDLAKLEAFVGPPLNLSFREIYGMDEKQTAEAIRWFRERYNETGVFENRLYPGVMDMLQSLHAAGKRLAIASSKPEQMVHKVLEHFDIKNCFDVIVGSPMSAEEDNRMGADNKLLMVQKALEGLGIRDGADHRKDCAMVGDRMFDMKGAKANKVAAVGVTYGYGSREELLEAGAEELAGSVEELERILLR